MDVKVSAKSGANGDIEWDIDGKKPKKSVIDFPRGSGQATVNFKLHDSTGLKLKFKSEDPFWAHEGAGENCPPSGSSSDQTRVTACDDKTLTVENLNSRKCSLQYQLNVVDENSTDHSVDPVIRNGGNG